MSERLPDFWICTIFTFSQSRGTFGKKHLISFHLSSGFVSCNKKVIKCVAQTKPSTITEVVEDLYNMVNERTRLRSPMISDTVYKIVMDNAEVSGKMQRAKNQPTFCLLFSFSLLASCYMALLVLFQVFNSAIIYDRDFSYNYFGFKVSRTGWLPTGNSQGC